MWTVHGSMSVKRSSADAVTPHCVGGEMHRFVFLNIFGREGRDFVQVGMGLSQLINQTTHLCSELANL